MLEDNSIRIDILLDSYASASEIDAVEAVAREEGILGSVQANLSSRFIGESQWVIYLSVPIGIIFYKFFGTIGEEAGKDAYQGIRRLISRLFGARRNTNGCVELRDDNTRTHIILTGDLPEEAYSQLAYKGLRQLKGGYWTWDSKLKEWRRL